MKKLLSLLSTLTIGSTAIPAGYAMYPYNLENNSKLSGEWNYGEKSFDWKDNYLTTNVGKPKLRDFIPVIYDTEVKIKELSSTIDLLWKKIAASEEDKTALEQSKKVLEVQLQMMQQVKEGLEKQIADATSHNTSLKAEIELKKLEISKLTKESQEKVSTLEMEVTQLKAKLADSEQNKLSLEQKIKELETNLEKVTEEKTALEVNLKDKSAKINDLNFKLDQANGEINNLNSQVADLKTKLEGSEQEKAALEASNKELQEKVNELTEKTQG
ncbi:MAG: hypothetical protein SPLM_04410 [Spiroplasma phoeniceum]|uniref:hypothetical protein n=1 Tax=Spiroplasma phoeniceum TaxID=47835 RepID=UPI00327B49F6